MRRVAPCHEIAHPVAYPTAVEAHPALSRRGFLLAGGGAAAGALLLGVARPRPAAAQPKPRVVTLNGLNGYVFRHGNHRIEKITLQCTDLAQADWIEKAPNAKAVDAALRKVFDAHSCVDLLDGKKLAALQLKAGAAALQTYRNATRRNGPAPTAVLFLGLPYDRCRGDCPAPVPYCRPPRP